MQTPQFMDEKELVKKREKRPNRLKLRVLVLVLLLLCTTSWTRRLSVGKK
jgi:hypothetical protein